MISIHPPREGWDYGTDTHGWPIAGFQSTHPVRGGTLPLQALKKIKGFQSTHPVRGGTLDRLV